MAQRVVVTLSDDIDGGEAAETVVFGLDGKSYEIDLNPANAKKLRRASRRSWRPAAGRRRSGKTFYSTPPSPPTRRPCAPGPAPTGSRCPPRGRIPKKVYEAFTRRAERRSLRSRFAHPPPLIR